MSKLIARIILSLLMLLCGLQMRAQNVEPDSTTVLDMQMVLPVEQDTIPATEVVADDYKGDLKGERIFNPQPERAIWLSALFPGLGQIYNRRYWKIPIIVGGFMGLGYATSWNSNQYQDYVQGYRDLMDNDPSTKSYLNFFPPNVTESSLDKGWLERTFKAKKDYFRRNRDICIISLVGMYLISMIDAYIDASMAQFDISSNLAVEMKPAVIPQTKGIKPAVGMSMAFTF